MYLRLDRRAPRRYTWGLFVFFDGLKSSPTHHYSYKSAYRTFDDSMFRRRERIYHKARWTALESRKYG